MKLFSPSEFAPIRLKLVELLEQVSTKKLYDYRAHDLFRQFLFDFGYKPQPQELNTSDDLTNWKRIKLIFKTNISFLLVNALFAMLLSNQLNLPIETTNSKASWSDIVPTEILLGFSKPTTLLYLVPIYLLVTFAANVTARLLTTKKHKNPRFIEDSAGYTTGVQYGLFILLLSPMFLVGVLVGGPNMGDLLKEILSIFVVIMLLVTTVSVAGVDGKVLESKEMPAETKERKKFPPPLEIFGTPEERMKWTTPQTLPSPDDLYYFDVLPPFARPESDSELATYFLEEPAIVDTNSPFFLLEQAIASKCEADCKGKLSRQAGAEIVNSITEAFEKGLDKYPIAAARGYRCTAEILESWGEIENAISYYEYALSCNPNAGVKRHLTSLKRKI
jgi:hypothetical protein